VEGGFKFDSDPPAMSDSEDRPTCGERQSDEGSQDPKISPANGHIQPRASADGAEVALYK